MRDLQLDLAQIAPTLGDLQRNLDLHLDAISAARKRRSKLVVFPELSLTGYFLNDLTEEVAMGQDHTVIKRIVAASRDTAVAFGFVERARDHRVYNSYALAEAGRIVHVHRKVYLPTYGLFDDGRYAAPGTRFDAFEASFGRAGILICEDAWHLASSYLLFLQDVDLILCPSASPAREVTERGELTSPRSWDAVLQAQSSLLQVYVAYCNRVGVEDGITFFGGSRVLDPFGAVVAKLDGLERGHVTAKLDDGALRRARLQSPMRRDDKPEIVLRQLRRILDAR